MLTLLILLCAVSAAPSCSPVFGVFPHDAKVTLNAYYTARSDTVYEAVLSVNKETVDLTCTNGECSADWPEGLFDASPFHYSIIGTESYKKCAYCNPEEEEELSCATDETIAVQSAVWGSSVQSLVDYAGSTSCPKDELEWDQCKVSVLEYVKSACDGKSKCIVPALVNAKVEKPSCVDAKGNDKQTFAAVQYMCQKKEATPDAVGCFSRLPEKFSVSLYPDRADKAYPSLLGKVVVGFVFNGIGNQCVGYGDSLNLSLTVNGVNKAVKFISGGAVHTAEYDFSLSKDNNWFALVTTLLSDSDDNCAHGVVLSQNVVLTGYGTSLLEKEITINAATVITYPPTPVNLNANEKDGKLEISWKKINTNTFEYCQGTDDDGFYNFSKDMYYIDGAREYCSKLDRSLMPTTRTRSKVNLLRTFLSKFHCPVRCEGFVGLRALRAYEKYNSTSDIFMWEDGSMDFELKDNCYTSQGTNCIWTDGQPDGNEPLFNVGYGDGLDDFNPNRKNKVFCEKKNFDAGKESAKYTVSVRDPENKLVWQEDYSNDVLGTSEFTVTTDKIDNNKTYTYTVEAVNGCAVSAAQRTVSFCYDESPGVFSKSDINVLSLSSTVTFALDLPDMGVACGTQQNTIKFDDDSGCSGIIDGLTVTVKCAIKADAPLTVRYTLSNGKLSTSGELKVTSVARTLATLQVLNPRQWAQSLTSQENYIYYVSTDENRSSYLVFHEQNLSGRDAETTSPSYVISLEDVSQKASSAPSLLKDVKPGTKIRPLFVQGKRYKVRMGFTDPITNAVSLSDTSISVQTVNDVLGPMITSPAFGATVQNKFAVSFEFSLRYTSYSVMLFCFGKNNSTVELKPEDGFFDVESPPSCPEGYGLKVKATTGEGAVFVSESQQLVFFTQDAGDCVSQHATLAALSPKGSAVTGLLSVHFEWSNAIDFCTSSSATYRLYVSNDDSFVAVGPVASGLRRNYHEHVFRASGTYYWFVELVDGTARQRTPTLRLTVCTSVPQITVAKPLSGYTVQVLGNEGVLEYAWSIETPQCYVTLYGDLVRYQLIVERDVEEAFDIPREGTYAYSLASQGDSKRIETHIRVSTPLQVTDSKSITVNVCTLTRPDTPVFSDVGAESGDGLDEGLAQTPHYIQKYSDKVTFHWSSSGAGKSCPDKGTETLEYVVKLLMDGETISEERVKRTSFDFVFGESGAYVFVVTADNGSVMSLPCEQPITVCVQKRPDDFVITYPVGTNALVLNAPVIAYTETPFNSDCNGGINKYCLYVKGSSDDEFQVVDNLSSNDDGTMTNYFDSGKSSNSSYCVYVEKSNGDLARAVKSQTVCFSFCDGSNMNSEGSSVGIAVDDVPRDAGARELGSAFGKTVRDFSENISVWKTVVFRVTKSVGVDAVDRCGIEPHVSFTAVNGDVRVALDYITTDTFVVDFPVPGTYSMVAALKVDTMELASMQKSVKVCIYKRPAVSAAITPADGAMLSPGEVSFRVTEISDWGDDCDWNLMSNGGSKSYLVHIRPPVGVPQAVGLNSLAAKVALTEEGVYEYYVETVFNNTEHTLSTSSETYTFTICRDKSPVIGKLSIADHAEEVGLSVNVTIGMASWGKDCEESSQDPYFVVMLYRFNGANDIADAEDIVPRQICSVKSRTASIRLPTLSPLTVYRLTVFAYTSSGKYYTFKSADFKTRALWCTPSPCKNGICDEFTASCTCPVDYTGKYCDKSVGGTIIVVAIVVPLVVVIVAILIALYLIYKKTNVFGLKMPDFTKYMFSMPKLLDDPQADAKTIEDIVYKDSFNGFEWAKALVQSTEPTELDNLTKALVYAYERNGKALSLLQSLIEWEVEQCTQEKTLFRSNSASTKCFKVYARMVGLPYLYRVVSPLLDKLLKDIQRQEVGVEVRGDAKHTKGMTTEFATEYELDTARVGAEEASDDLISTNMLSVQFACQIFLSSLQKTSAHCPTEFRIISSTIKAAVLQKFPEYKVEHALSAFLFLRFFVAALSVPESFGLLDAPPSSQLRRQLIIISKVVSNFSTKVKFGSKEEYMLPMNDFLEANEHVLDSYYESIIQRLSDTLTPVQVPDRFHHRSIEVLAVQSKKVEK